MCSCSASAGRSARRGCAALLSGAESASELDFRECEHFVGSSAGSIVAATLAAGRRPEAGDRAAREWGEMAVVDAGQGLLARAATAAATPLAPLALAGVAPAGRAMRAAALRVVPGATRTLGRLGHHLDSLGAEFDGRLRIAAVDRRSGRRVMFGAPGAPPARVSEAVLASCAVPGVFSPVEIGGREYVDGGVWSPTNLDAAPAGRGAEVLCLVPDRRRVRRPARVHPRAPLRRDAGAALPRRARPDDPPRRRLHDGDGRQPDGRLPRRAGPRRGVRPRPLYGVGVSSCSASSSAAAAAASTRRSALESART